MRVSVIIPTKGRHDQLAALLPRLKDTAQYDDVEYIVVADDDQKGADIARLKAPWAKVINVPQRRGYWNACAVGQASATGQLSIALANDLLPSRGWLARGIGSYRRKFGERPGMLGANDGAQGVSVAGDRVTVWLEHASHFLIHRDLLAHFGGWPVWYDHSHGDLELSVRARELGVFGIEPLFVLFHNHWLTGAGRDEVYTLGEQQISRDEALYRQRRDRGWPVIGSASSGA